MSKYLAKLIPAFLIVSLATFAGADAKTKPVKVFLIALEDGGKRGRRVGCGDSVVGVRREVDISSGSLRAAVGKLLTLRKDEADSGDLYNALAESRLSVKSVSLKGGKVTIHLTGQLLIGGACDAPRIEAQIRETALQFPTVKSAVILVNGQPLEKLLSGR